MWLRQSFNSRRLRIILGAGLLAASFLCVSVSFAQEVHQELQETVKAKVLEIVEQSDRQIMGTDATTTVQTLRIELLAGQKVGQVVALDNDIMVLDVGDVIFVN